MVRAARLRGFKGESALGNFLDEELITNLQIVELRCEFSVRHKFNEEFDFTLMWCRCDRISPLPSSVGAFECERCVLSWRKFECAACVDADRPQVRSDIDTLGDTSA